MSDEKTDQQKYLEAVHAKAKQQNEILEGDSVFVFASRMAAVGIRKITIDELTIELDDSAFGSKPAAQPAYVYPAAQGPAPASFTTSVGVPPGVITMASGCGTYSGSTFILP